MYYALFRQYYLLSNKSACFVSILYHDFWLQPCCMNVLEKIDCRKIKPNGCK